MAIFAWGEKKNLQHFASKIDNMLYFSTQKDEI